jgi:predicted nicotinamide N-methyase
VPIVDPLADPTLSLRDLRFAHGDLALRLSLPRSADELIDEARFWADERLPYWADLWPSARALARYLYDHPPCPQRERRIIELGCGAVALGSLTLASKGFDVLATDYEEDALASVRSNRHANGLGDESGGLRTKIVDWRDPPADLGVFDFAFAADVMYEQRNALALAHAVPKILASPESGGSGRFVLADPGRRYLPEFQGRMKQRGWIERELAVIDEPNEKAHKPVSRVRILEYRSPGCRA